MAYIVPDTELEFFQNLNLDPGYENTIYFATTTNKDNYFNNLPSIKCPNCTYQRERRGYCRVEVPISRMYDRCYMRFRNRQYENKWFYAFVDNPEYINNITTEIHYTIDVMMTWMGSFTLEQCYVERNHTETDDIGDNVVPEMFDTGIKVNNYRIDTGYFDDWVFMAVFEPDDTNLTPSNNKFGYPTALHYSFAANITDFTTLPSLLQQRLLGIYYVPLGFLPEIANEYPTAIQSQVVNHGAAPVSHIKSISGPVAGVTKLDGYIPKNNKLYTYPFYHLTVENTEGERHDYLFELSKTQSIDFDLRGVVGELTQIALIPRGYNTPEQDTQGTMLNYSEKMEMNNFPMCGWTIDTYKAFLAQQMVSLPASLVGAGIEAATGNLPTAISVGAQPLTNLISGSIRSAIQPYKSEGKDTPQLGLTVGAEFKDFYFYKRSIRGFQAKIIDDYFTMFGYAINEVKQPSINARPYYTYVKTIGCHIGGSFPADDRKTIEDIFDRGVRFWNEDHTHIGDYSVNNAPVSNNP